MLRIFSLIFILIALCGCSQLRLAYNHGSWLMRQKIHAYVSFRSEQKERIRREVDTYFVSHRRTLLPRYGAFLKQVDSKLTDRLAMADIASLRTQGFVLFYETLRPLLSPAVAVLQTLDAAQINELEESLQRQDRRYRDQWLSGDEKAQKNHRADWLLEMIEQWTGALSRRQRVKVKELSLKISFLSTYWADNRIRQQTKIVELLRRHASSDEIMQILKEWLLEADAHRSAEQTAMFAKFYEAFDQFLLEVWKMLDPPQRAVLRETVRSYARVFAELAGQGK